MRIFILLFITFSITAQDIVWTHNSPIIRTFSSIRTTDLNNDNIKYDNYNYLVDNVDMDDFKIE